MAVMSILHLFGTGYASDVYITSFWYVVCCYKISITRNAKNEKKKKTKKQKRFGSQRKNRLKGLTTQTITIFVLTTKCPEVYTILVGRMVMEIHNLYLNTTLNDIDITDCVIQIAGKKTYRLKIASIRKPSVAITHPNHNFSSCATIST
jgi:hypothetical protein